MFHRWTHALQTPWTTQPGTKLEPVTPVNWLVGSPSTLVSFLILNSSIKAQRSNEAKRLHRTTSRVRWRTDSVRWQSAGRPLKWIGSQRPPNPTAPSCSSWLTRIYWLLFHQLERCAGEHVRQVHARGWSLKKILAHPPKKIPDKTKKSEKIRFFGGFKIRIPYLGVNNPSGW